MEIPYSKRQQAAGSQAAGQQGSRQQAAGSQAARQSGSQAARQQAALIRLRARPKPPLSEGGRAPPPSPLRGSYGVRPRPLSEEACPTF